MNIVGGEDARGRVSLCACMLSHFSRFWLSVAPWNIARQAPLFMGFSSQEYWSGLPFSPPKDLPNPGIEPTTPTSPALQEAFSQQGHQGFLFTCFQKML